MSRERLGKRDGLDWMRMTKCATKTRLPNLNMWLVLRSNKGQLKAGIRNAPSKANKNCYIGVTRPTLKLGPTLHFFKPKKKEKRKKKKKKNQQQQQQPTDPKKSKTCDFFPKNVNFGVLDLVGSLECVFVCISHTCRNLNFAKNVTTLLHWADDMKCLINSVKNSSSKKKSLPTDPIFVQPVTPV